MFEKRFEVRKFFVGTNRTPSLSEQSADSSEEPTCRPRPNSRRGLTSVSENIYLVLKKWILGLLITQIKFVSCKTPEYLASTGVHPPNESYPCVKF